jgi:hypothetical protein
MRRLTGKLRSLALLTTAGLICFGWWGLRTQAGVRAFDEMDGLIPFFAGVLGIIGLCAVAVISLFQRYRS